MAMGKQCLHPCAKLGHHEAGVALVFLPPPFPFPPTFPRPVALFIIFSRCDKIGGYISSFLCSLTLLFLFGLLSRLACLVCLLFCCGGRCWSCSSAHVNVWLFSQLFLSELSLSFNFPHPPTYQRPQTNKKTHTHRPPAD